MQILKPIAILLAALATLVVFMGFIDLATSCKLYVPSLGTVVRTGKDHSGYIGTDEQTTIKFDSGEVQTVPGYRGAPGTRIVAQKTTAHIVSCFGWIGDITTVEGRKLYNEADQAVRQQWKSEEQ